MCHMKRVFEFSVRFCIRLLEYFHVLIHCVTLDIHLKLVQNLLQIFIAGPIEQQKEEVIFKYYSIVL